MTNRRPTPEPSTFDDTASARLLIPLDAEEAILALARFRYSAEHYAAADGAVGASGRLSAGG